MSSDDPTDHGETRQPNVSDTSHAAHAADDRQADGPFPGTSQKMSAGQPGRSVRPRRHRRAPAVAAAAAVLLAGGGGAYWAAGTTGGETDRASTQDEPALVPASGFEVKSPGSGRGYLLPSHPTVRPGHPKQPSGKGRNEASGKPPQSGQQPGTPPTVQPAPPGAPGDGDGSADSGGDSGHQAVRQAVTTYSADGHTLKLSFWGGVCDDYRAKAKESGDTVRVSVHPADSDGDKICVKMAKRQHVKVALDKPLGDRKVVDSRDGETLPRR